MYKVNFNSECIAVFDKEQDSLALGLNLHQHSNIPHNIVVTKEGEEIIIFIQK